MKGQVSWFERMAFQAAHPVGEYFWTSSAENPGDRYGGTWTQIKDVFLLAAGDSYAAGSTGGEATHKLTVSEMPNHTHVFPKCAGWPSETAGAFEWGVSYVNGESQVMPYTTWPGCTNGSGEGYSHNNMPPYRAAYCWQRTA